MERTDNQMLRKHINNAHLRIQAIVWILEDYLHILPEACYLLCIKENFSACCRNKLKNYLSQRSLAGSGGAGDLAIQGLFHEEGPDEAFG